jgi:hypothetical protein
MQVSTIRLFAAQLLLVLALESFPVEAAEQEDQTSPVCYWILYLEAIHLQRHCKIEIDPAQLHNLNLGLSIVEEFMALFAKGNLEKWRNNYIDNLALKNRSDACQADQSKVLRQFIDALAAPGMPDKIKMSLQTKTDPNDGECL